MARRSSFAQRAAQRQRELERQSRARQRAQTAAARAAERTRKAYDRAQAFEEKERRRLYLEARAAEADEHNEWLAAVDAALEDLLGAAVARDAYVDLESLKEEPRIPPFHAGALAVAEPAPLIENFVPPPPSGIGKLVRGAGKKHARAVDVATARFNDELTAHTEREDTRIARFEAAKQEHETAVLTIQANADAQNAEIDDLRSRLAAEEPAAIVEYFSLVLNQSPYPDGFPRAHKMAFVPESRQLVVEYELPSIDVVPTIKGYKYVKARDTIDESPRAAAQIKRLYSLVVAETALRSLHELFEADRDAKLETIVLNGFVDTVDPATGKPISPHLVTVRVSRDSFRELDLSNVEPFACLKGLNAAVSKSPTELVPVRPILEFDMVDPRFVQESDVLRALDERPNLMELSPRDFESLITNLFEKMGLETRQTQASRDGGVDCVAYDARPILGGKVVIQAKRYKNTVGVSAVRDLFGTLQNEGAS
jgi:restriction system protein